MIASQGSENASQESEPLAERIEWPEFAGLIDNELSWIGCCPSCEKTHKNVEYTPINPPFSFAGEESELIFHSTWKCPETGEEHMDASPIGVLDQLQRATKEGTNVIT